MDSYFVTLALTAHTTEEKKILEIFINEAGDALEVKSQLALDLITQGKSFGRALADSLEEK